MDKFIVQLVLVYFGIVSCQNAVESPNFVIFMSDDQDLTLGGMGPMANVHKLISNEGAVFTNSFVASPICCPSRASVLTGQYPHNHGTVNNSASGGCYGESWRRVEDRTFAAILQENGYETFYAGKYLNQYGTKMSGGPTVVPVGWSKWHGLVGNSVYYNYTLSNDGVPSHEDNQYLTDVIHQQGLDFLMSWQKDETRSPFLMMLSPPAPHQPFTPAPRHEGAYSTVDVLQTPSFNVSASDKHWLMRMSPSPLPRDMLAGLSSAYRSRWETLLAVDEMVAGVVNLLENIGQINNTYVIYTSDNGYHIGQFSQVLDKRQPYETDIRVPLIIRGPGIDKKSLVHNPTMNIDLAPTILSLAGIEVPLSMDGVPINFTTAGLKAEFSERHMLVEYYGEGSKGTVDERCSDKLDGTLSECSPAYACKCQDSRNNTYACVRHLDTNINYKYCLFNDTEKFEEMYNLDEDPYELRNTVHEALPALRVWYQLVLQRLYRCSGAQCNIDSDMQKYRVR